jgi:hypothetical protein
MSVSTERATRRAGQWQRRLITLVFAGWLPHFISPSRSCLGLRSWIIALDAHADDSLGFRRAMAADHREPSRSVSRPVARIRDRRPQHRPRTLFRPRRKCPRRIRPRYVVRCPTGQLCWPDYAGSGPVRPDGLLASDVARVGRRRALMASIKISIDSWQAPDQIPLITARRSAATPPARHAIKQTL